MVFFTDGDGKDDWDKDKLENRVLYSTISFLVAGFIGAWCYLGSLIITPIPEHLRYFNTPLEIKAEESYKYKESSVKLKKCWVTVDHFREVSYLFTINTSDGKEVRIHDVLGDGKLDLYEENNAVGFDSVVEIDHGDTVTISPVGIYHKGKWTRDGLEKKIAQMEELLDDTYKSKTLWDTTHTD
jgi:hypothetical protein